MTQRLLTDWFNPIGRGEGESLSTETLFTKIEPFDIDSTTSQTLSLAPSPMPQNIPTPLYYAPSTPSRRYRPSTPLSNSASRRSHRDISPSPLSRDPFSTPRYRERSPLSPPPTTPSHRGRVLRCSKPGCSTPYTRSVTRSSNRKGNAGRPYYKCVPCNDFKSFADDRGKGSGNPSCQCGVGSRRLVTRQNEGTRRKLFYKCADGICRFYEDAKDEKGNCIMFDDVTADVLAALKLV